MPAGPEFLSPESWNEVDAQSRAYGEVNRVRTALPSSAFRGEDLSTIRRFLASDLPAIRLGTYMVDGKPVLVYIASNKKLYVGTGRGPRERFSKLIYVFQTTKELNDLAELIRSIAR